MEEYRDIRARIDACANGHDARRVRVAGCWVGLRSPGEELLEIWRRHTSGDREVAASNRATGLRTARVSDDGDAFVEGAEWYGGIPGDALATMCELLFAELALLRVWTVDSCTMTSIDVEVFGADGCADPARVDAITDEVVAALRALQTRR